MIRERRRCEDGFCHHASVQMAVLRFTIAMLPKYGPFDSTGPHGESHSRIARSAKRNLSKPGMIIKSDILKQTTEVLLTRWDRIR